MKQQRSLRARIAISSAIITASALLVLALGTSVYVYFEDLEAIDEHLIGEATELIADFGTGEIEQDEFTHDDFEPRLGMAAITAAGETIGITPSFPAAVATKGAKTPGFSFQSHGDSRWRVYHASTDDIIISVGHNLEEFDDVLVDLLSIQLLLVPLVAAVTAWLSWLVAGRALAPIRRATTTATEIGVGDLTARLPVGRKDDEIGQFTIVLNHMLDRIEKNYLQARRFAGDASHELKTPLTIIKGELENVISNHELPPTAEHRIVSAQQEVDRMHQIIDQLLLLARFDAGKASADFTPINLSQLLHDLAEDVDLLGAQLELKITHSIAPGIHVRGDTTQLHRLFLNLFTNAAKYNRPQGSLDYRLVVANGHAKFTVSNTGPVIAAADSEKIFERFYQVDTSHAARGSGLGLSLCREIAHAHGGTIHLESSSTATTTFQVELPTITVG